jgi:hypothetical protein
MEVLFAVGVGGTGFMVTADVVAELLHPVVGLVAVTV